MTVPEGGTAEQTAGVQARERYGLILALILGGYVLGGFNDSAIVRLGNALIWMVVLLTALWSPGIPVRLRQAASVGVIAFFVLVTVLAFVDNDTVVGVMVLVVAAMQFLTVLAILSRIALHDRVRLQTVMGGIAAYAMLAFAMAAVYRGVDLLLAEPLLDGVVAQGDYQYFSFVTLTTLGYGDIVPATDVGKRLVVIEGFAGQVFLVTLVARLVSLWEPRRSRNL